MLLEEEVIRKSRKNPSAFRYLYEKYFRKVFLFVFHRVGDRDTSADITSQVFLKALQRIDQFTFRGLPFSSWLLRIAVNECNDFFRKSTRRRLVILEEKHSDLLYEEMFGTETMDALKAKLPRVLQALKPEELQVIELRFLEGRPFREVSEILRITETTFFTEAVFDFADEDESQASTPPYRAHRQYRVRPVQHASFQGSGGSDPEIPY